MTGADTSDFTSVFVFMLSQNKVKTLQFDDFFPQGSRPFNKSQIHPCQNNARDSLNCFVDERGSSVCFDSSVFKCSFKLKQSSTHILTSLKLMCFKFSSEPNSSKEPRVQFSAVEPRESGLSFLTPRVVSVKPEGLVT